MFSLTLADLSRETSLGAVDLCLSPLVQSKARNQLSGVCERGREEGAVGLERLQTGTQGGTRSGIYPGTGLWSSGSRPCAAAQGGARGAAWAGSRPQSLPGAESQRRAHRPRAIVATAAARLARPRSAGTLPAMAQISDQTLPGPETTVQIRVAIQEAEDVEDLEEDDEGTSAQAAGDPARYLSPGWGSASEEEPSRGHR